MNVMLVQSPHTSPQAPSCWAHTSWGTLNAPLALIALMVLLDPTGCFLHPPGLPLWLLNLFLNKTVEVCQNFFVTDF
jgi:hypothetical protein